jgi:hypothetical protein
MMGSEFVAGAMIAVFIRAEAPGSGGKPTGLKASV